METYKENVININDIEKRLLTIKEGFIKKKLKKDLLYILLLCINQFKKKH